MHYLQHHEKGDGVPGDGNDLVLGDELQPLLLRQCVLRRPLNGAFDGHVAEMVNRNAPIVILVYDLEVVFR